MTVQFVLERPYPVLQLLNGGLQLVNQPIRHLHSFACVCAPDRGSLAAFEEGANSTP